MSKVSVVGCESYEANVVSKALRKALEPFEFLERIAKGTRIVIKANLVSMMKPEAAATTHPALLCELCRVLTDKGADVVVGDSPGGLYTAAYVSGVYNATGVTSVTKFGARLNNNFDHKHAENAEGLVLKELDYTSYLDNAEIIINFCKLKTHGMMGMSACVKNMFGCIPGVFKPEYHYKYPNHEMFADMLIDLNERFKAELCIVDAVIAMEGNGPTAGKPHFVGALLASDSPYDCDRICAQIIGLEPEKVETISAASRRGLERIPVIYGDYKQFIQKDFELVRQRKEISFTSGNSFTGFIIQKALCSVPDANRRECIGCEKCARICPAKAIKIKKRLPVIDRNACIRCFCCQEFCPKGAMKVKRPLIAKLLNR